MVAAYLPWLAYLLLIAGGIYLWRAASLRAARENAMRVLRYIESAISGHGHVAGIEWVSASKFSVPLRLRGSIFHNPSVLVQLTPREWPFGWVTRLLRRRKETITFRADLDRTPGFNLELGTHRMFARSRRHLKPEGPSWQFENTTPFILTTRMDWQQEISSLITSLSTCSQRNFLNVCFRRSSPHFSATLPLECISPEAENRTALFDALRELAAGAQPGLRR
jgi:hypothetical protein